MTPSKQPQHDRLVCGIDPGYPPVCPGCIAQAEAAEREFYERNERALERHQRRKLAEQFSESTGISIADLADCLLPELAGPVARIVGIVLDRK